MSKQARRTAYYCPIDAALGIFGGKYKTIILYNLLQGTLRYHELQNLMPQATPKMLTQQLRELEEDGVIRRTVYPVVPPKTEYSITEYGRTLEPVLREMYQWGQRYMGDKIVDRPCGGSSEKV